MSVPSGVEPGPCAPTWRNVPDTEPPEFRARSKIVTVYGIDAPVSPRFTGPATKSPLAFAPATGGTPSPLTSLSPSEGVSTSTLRSASFARPVITRSRRSERKVATTVPDVPSPVSVGATVSSTACCTPLVTGSTSSNFTGESFVPRFNWNANAMLPSATRAVSGEFEATRSSSAAVNVKVVNGASSATVRCSAISGGFGSVWTFVPKNVTTAESPLTPSGIASSIARFAGPEIWSMPIASEGAEVIAAAAGGENAATR